LSFQRSSRVAAQAAARLNPRLLLPPLLLACEVFFLLQPPQFLLSFIRKESLKQVRNGGWFVGGRRKESHDKWGERRGGCKGRRSLVEWILKEELASLQPVFTRKRELFSGQNLARGKESAILRKRPKVTPSPFSPLPLHARRLPRLLSLLGPPALAARPDVPLMRAARARSSHAPFPAPSGSRAASSRAGEASACRGRRRAPD